MIPRRFSPSLHGPAIRHLWGKRLRSPGFTARPSAHSHFVSKEIPRGHIKKGAAVNLASPFPDMSTQETSSSIFPAFFKKKQKKTWISIIIQHLFRVYKIVFPNRKAFTLMLLTGCGEIILKKKKLQHYDWVCLGFK